MKYLINCCNDKIATWNNATCPFSASHPNYSDCCCGPAPGCHNRKQSGCCLSEIIILSSPTFLPGIIRCLLLCGDWGSQPERKIEYKAKLVKFDGGCKVRSWFGESWLVTHQTGSSTWWLENCLIHINSTLFWKNHKKLEPSLKLENILTADRRFYIRQHPPSCSLQHQHGLEGGHKEQPAGRSYFYTTS